MQYFRLRLLVPVVGEYRVDIHCGNWGSNAAILVLNNGTVSAWNPAQAIKVGGYTIEKWDDLAVDFDFAKKTYVVSFNGARARAIFPGTTRS